MQTAPYTQQINPYGGSYTYNPDPYGYSRTAMQTQQSNSNSLMTVPVWSGCCETLSIRNTSDQPILVQNANVILTRSNQSVMASC